MMQQHSLLQSIFSDPYPQHKMKMTHLTLLPTCNIQRSSDPECTFLHTDFLLYILKEPPYTNLTLIGLLQKQNGFDKIGRSVHFLISMPGHRNYSTVFNGEA